MIRQAILVFCALAVVAGLHVTMNHEAATLPPGHITIKADNGKYLTRCPACGTTINPQTIDPTGFEPTVTNAAVWKIRSVAPGSNRITLTADNGKYLSACVNCWNNAKYNESATVSLNSTVYPSTIWVYEERGNGKWLLKNNATQKYLSRCADCINGVNRDYGFVYTPSTGIGVSWLQFTIEYVFPTGKVTLQANNGLFISRCHGCGPSFLPDSASLHIADPRSSQIVWLAEKWGDKIALRSPDTLNYLGRCTNCWFGSTIPDSAFVHIWTTRDPAALWTPIYLGNGKWALRSDLGRHLSMCTYCVPGGAYANFVFVHVDSPSEGPWAHWVVNTV